MARKIITPKSDHTHTLPGKTHDQVGLERLVFFSDAVFAIAITLLSLEIRLPANIGPLSNAELFQQILAIWPKYLAFAISFLVIGLFWASHHRKFRLIQGYDNNLISLNLLLLMTIAFIPFPTSLISEYGNRTATIFYASVLILAGLLSIAIWLYASHKNRLIDPLLDIRQRRREIVGPLLSIAIFVLSIGLAFIDVGLARLSWVLIIFMQRVYR
jgi:uncharacterized membrane protein